VGRFGFPFGSASAARIRYLAIGLRELGVQVEVASQLPILYRPEDRQSDGTYCYAGIRYRSFAGALNHGASRFANAKQILAGTYRAWRELEQILNQRPTDIIVGYSWDASGLEPIVRAGNQKGIPVVFDVVEWPDSFYFKGGYLHPLYWSKEWAMRRTNFKASALITISSYLFCFYAQRAMKAVRIPAITCVPSSPSPRTAKPANSPFSLMYVGSPTPKDGVFDMLEAVRLLLKRNRAVSLTVVGDRGRGVNESMEEIVNREPLMRDAVYFTGWVQQERVPEHLAQSDALILARPAGRFAEAGFPTKLAEYMASARPVVVTAVGDIPEYVHDGVHGVVVRPGDPSVLADGIERVMDLPDHGASWGEAAWVQASKVFDYRAHTPGLKRFLTSIAAS
jgi:glycosyltransferase involved in cell wall biosynthesis